MVELGTDREMSLRAVRALIRDFDEYSDLPLEDFRFPLEAHVAEMLTQSEAMHQEIEALLVPFKAWSKNHDRPLLAGDWQAAFRQPTDAEKHAAQRLGVHPAQVKLAARVLWNHTDFEQERDSRVGDIDEIEPRSRQARRGLVAREMLAELKTFLDEVLPEQEAAAGGDPQ